MVKVGMSIKTIKAIRTTKATNIIKAIKTIKVVKAIKASKVMVKTARAMIKGIKTPVWVVLRNGMLGYFTDDTLAAKADVGAFYVEGTSGEMRRSAASPVPTYTGSGTSTDIVVASAQAYLSAINKLIAKEARSGQ